MADFEASETANTTAVNTPKANVRREPKKARIPTRVTEIDRFIDLSPQTPGETGQDGKLDLKLTGMASADGEADLCDLSRYPAAPDLILKASHAAPKCCSTLISVLT